MSTQLIHDVQMNALRKCLVDAGLEPSMDPFCEFFTGRNPACGTGGGRSLAGSAATSTRSGQTRRRAAHSPPNRYRTAVWVRCRTKASVSAAGAANSGP